MPSPPHAPRSCRFNPRPRARAKLVGVGQADQIAHGFNPRPRARAKRVHDRIGDEHRPVSIHALARGRNADTTVTPTWDEMVSIHAPSGSPPSESSRFNPRPRARANTPTPAMASSSAPGFNPRPRARAKPGGAQRGVDRGERFNPRPRARAKPRRRVWR